MDKGRDTHSPCGRLQKPTQAAHWCLHLETLKYLPAWFFSSVFDFCKQTSGPHLENTDPARRDGREELSAQARERMCLTR